MPAPSDQRPIVRMFPDYSYSVLWLDGPVGYGESGLSAALIEALQAWERSYYQALTPEFEWKSVELARRFTSEGNRLARMVADELGETYEVEFDSYEEGKTVVRYRASAGTTPNPGALP